MPIKKQIKDGKLKCGSCKKDYELSFFFKNKKSSNGYYSYCKRCSYLKNMNSYVNHRNLSDIEDIDGEIWVDIKGFEGLYQISNKQRIKSLERYVCFENGDKILKRKAILLKPRITKSGYMRINLYRVNDNFKKYYFIHKLMLESFVPNPENKPCVNHINGIKTDNSLENLEWCTIAENNRHAIDTGLWVAKKGEDVYNAKSTNDEIRLIRRFYRMYPNTKQRDFAKRINMPYKKLNAILKNKLYKCANI